MGDVTGMNIVVIGAGPIGNLVAQSAKGMGAAKVMITDVSDLRLEKAKECGIDVCVNTWNKNFGEAFVEAFGSDKADVIYDCAGNNITMGQAIKYARKGSVIVLVAVFAGMAEIDLAVANDHELDIKSTMMYRPPHSDIRRNKTIRGAFTSGRAEPALAIGDTLVCQIIRNDE